jgi:hypothetical protein
LNRKKSVSFDGGPVGYKRPPAEHQFKKGIKPPGSGRKKGSKNYAALITELMESRVPVTIDGKRRMIPVKRALLLRGIAGGLTGNVNDVVRVFDLVARLAPREIVEPLVVQFRKMAGDDW